MPPRKASRKRVSRPFAIDSLCEDEVALVAALTVGARGVLLNARQRFLSSRSISSSAVSESSDRIAVQTRFRVNGTILEPTACSAGRLSVTEMFSAFECRAVRPLAFTDATLPTGWRECQTNSRPFEGRTHPVHRVRLGQISATKRAILRVPFGQTRGSGAPLSRLLRDRWALEPAARRYFRMPAAWSDRYS